MGQHTNQAPHRTAQVSSSAATQNARAYSRNEKVPTAIVIGGGPSGLISARRLAAAGMRVTLLEQRHHLGGAVGAHEVGGLLLDSGAESFATSSRNSAWATKSSRPTPTAPGCTCRRAPAAPPAPVSWVSPATSTTSR